MSLRYVVCDEICECVLDMCYVKKLKREKNITCYVMRLF